MSNLKRTAPIAPKGATVMMFANGKLVGGTVNTLPHLGKSLEATDKSLAYVKLANDTIAALRAGKVNSDPALLVPALYRMAADIEGLDPHLAGDLEVWAERLAA